MARGPRNGAVYRRIRAELVKVATHCYRCKEPLNKTVEYPHPLYPTLEHIVPLSQGGSLLDRANLAVSHLRCNASAGDGVSRSRPRGGYRPSRAW